MNFSEKSLFLLTFVVVIFIMPQTTFAYLDPGSGSFIIQMTIASIAGITFALRAYIARAMYFIKYKILGLSKKEDESVMDTVESDENS